MQLTEQSIEERLFFEALGWTDKEKELFIWIILLYIRLNDSDFFHRTEVLRYCDNRDFEALKTLYDDMTTRMSYEEMKKFLCSIKFCEWFDEMKKINKKLIFIFFMMYISYIMNDADIHFFKERYSFYLSTNSEANIFFLTLYTILENDKNKRAN